MRPCQRRMADTRIRGSGNDVSSTTIRIRARRARCRELLDLDEPDGRDGPMTSCAMRIPGSTTNASLAVRVDEHDADLAAVARVDEPGRVHDADAVACGEARARLDEPAYPSGISTAMPGRNHRALARREDDALAGREIESGVALVGLLGQVCVVAETPDGDIDHRAETSSRSCSPATR